MMCSTCCALADALAQQGFRTTRSIGAPNHITFSVDGVTTGFGVFCAADSVARVANLLAEVQGVEVVSARTAADRFLVQARDASGRVQTAHIDWRRDSTAAASTSPMSSARFRYAVHDGDPLELLPVLADMRTVGAIDVDGFASEADWIGHSMRSRYPAAVTRIVHGHVYATRNPAPILVSVSDDFRVGLSMMSVANRMRPLGGTHGALGETNAVGVLLSNTVVPRDDVAWRVRTQFGGFDDLRTPLARPGMAHIISSADLRRDRFAQRSWTAWRTIPDSTALVVLGFRPEELRGGRDSVWVRFEVRERDPSSDEGRLLRSVALPLSSAWQNTDAPLRAWTAASAGLTGLDTNAAQFLRVELEYRRAAAGSSVIAHSQTWLQTPLRVAPDGIPWSY
jgi:hypothetical protein